METQNETQNENAASSSLGRRKFLSTGSQAALAATFLAAADVIAAPKSKSGSNAASAPAASASPPAKDIPAPIELDSIDEGKPAKEPQPARMNRDQRVGYAIVGLGHLTLAQILPAMLQSKRAKVVALVSGDRKKAERVADMYDVPREGIYSYENFDEIAKNPAIQAVYIVLPNSMHLEFTLRAARAGKHVLCEKPMANTVEEAEQMVKACADARVQLMIAYRIQYEPRTREAMKWIRDKKVLGQAKLLDMVNIQNQSKTNLNQWRHKKALAGGGALPDIGLYCLNTARYLTGEEPIEVGAMQDSTPGDARFKEIEETVSWWMRFPSGLIAQCLTSYGAFGTKRWRANCEKGFVEMDPAFPYSGLKLKRSRKADEVLGLKGEEEETFQAEDKNQFIAELDHFAECVVKNQKPYTPGEEGLQDQRIMKAIYESAASGRPVKLEHHSGLDKFRGTKPTEEPK